MPPGTAALPNRSELLAWRRSASRGLPFVRDHPGPVLRELRGFELRGELDELRAARDIPGRLPGRRWDAELQRRASRPGTRLQIRWCERVNREISPLHPRESR